jgi:hemolysin activation/secretion protein
VSLAAAAAAVIAVAPRWALGQGTPAPAPQAKPSRKLEITEYRIEGATQLPAIEIERAVSPFLGPGRAIEDVERARQALEQAYSEKGFHSVAVSIPEQTVRDGVIRLVVTEGKVGRLRVRGADWFSPRDVKQLAPSVAEGTVPNFNAIVQDIMVLNQIPDRRVTPALRPSAIPGIIDVDLTVEDALPLHGSLEVNDRYSANTVPRRVAGSLHYDNLWQQGHSMGFSFQVAPERPDDSKIFTGTYLARFPGVTWLYVSVNGVVQRSEVTTVGGVGVTGKGDIVGARANFTLPSGGAFFHTAGVGLDYKHFDEGVTVGTSSYSTPLTYFPATATYGATWSQEPSETQLSLAVVFNIRGLGSNALEFDAKRYGASGNFIYFRGDLSRTDDVPAGIQLIEHVTGQYSSEALTRFPWQATGPTITSGTAGAQQAATRYGEALVGSEQLTAGGATTVRGYMEAEAAGDTGAIGSFEVRSPSLTRWLRMRYLDEWRFLAFVEGAWLKINRALPQQKSRFELASVGGGIRVGLRKYVHGAVDVGVPLASDSATRRFTPRMHFRVWTEF